MKNERESRGCDRVGSNAANQRRRGGGFVPDAARRWLCAR